MTDTQTEKAPFGVRELLLKDENDAAMRIGTLLAMGWEIKGYILEQDSGYRRVLLIRETSTAQVRGKSAGN